MPRCLLLLALSSAACFSDDPPQLTVGVTGDSSTGETTGAPTTGVPTTGLPTTGELTSTGTTEAIGPTSTTTGEPETTGEPTTGEPLTDACKDADPLCPVGPTDEPGAGLELIDRCNFPLHAGPEWQTHGELLDQLAIQLPTHPLADVLVDLDAAALATTDVPGVEAPEFAMRWDIGDFALRDWWLPRSLASSVDAFDSGLLGDREALLVGWRFDQSLTDLKFDKGVRISLVDPGELRYRHILLVEPVAGDPVDFKPVASHAGGIAWYGDTLYVTDGARLRLFDLSRLLEVQAELDQVGYSLKDGNYHGGQYRYAAVQIGAYQLLSVCNEPQLSTLALDRSVSPPQLIAAEYCDANTCSSPHHGRIFAWEIDPVTGHLPHSTTWPSAAAYMHEQQIRGAARSDNHVFLASRALADDAGALHVLPDQSPSALHPWIDAPMAVTASGDLIWGLSEKVGARFVFAVAREGYQ